MSEIGSGQRTSIDAMRSGELTSGELPVSGGSLVGRQEIVSQIVEQLDPGRVVTLTGMGGVGKTSVSIEVARAIVNDPDRFSDGCWFVEMAAVADEASIPVAITDAIGMFQNDDATPYESVVTGLRGLRGLLVIDNCEQIAGAMTGLLHRLLSDCTDLAVLATSREPLRMEAERVIAIETLNAGTGAYELFARRAVEADGSFDPLAHASAISTICNALDGLPLALELAAARLGTMTAEDIASRLDERFRMLRDPSVSGRNNSLYATVSWSYELLQPVERRLFDRLSVFQGGFDEQAAMAMLDPRDRGVDVRVVLGALVDKSMVNVVSAVARACSDEGSSAGASRGDTAPNNAPEAAGRRYDLLETLRHFGDRQLARRNERAAVRNQHLDHMIEVVAAANAFALSNDWAEGARRFRQDWANIRAAVNWAIDTTRVDDVDRLLRDVHFYCRWSLEAEAAIWAKRAISRGTTIGAVPGTPAHLHVGFQLFLAGDHEAALEELQRGLAARGTPSDRGWCRHYAAVELLYLGRAAEAADQAAVDFSDESPRSVEAVIRSSSITAFQMYARQVHHDEAAARFAKYAQIAEKSGNSVAQGDVHFNSALCAYGRGDVDTYLAKMGDALEVARRDDIPNLTGYILTAQVHAPGWSGLRGALDALEYWNASRNIGNEFVVLEAVGINLAEMRRLEPAAVILGNLHNDRRKMTSSMSRRQACIGEIALHRSGEAWMEAGAAMSRTELLAYTKRATIEALESL
ncbi:ATP-binding protein [Ilumatobacter sp.]|uniref:ATP-binding protein n=1 Tax=Ilumatobacter sp. TaxID=1967498 RepID=UPI00375270B9